MKVYSKIWIIGIFLMMFPQHVNSIPIFHIEQNITDFNITCPTSTYIRSIDKYGDLTNYTCYNDMGDNVTINITNTYYTNITNNYTTNITNIFNYSINTTNNITNNITSNDGNNYTTEINITKISNNLTITLTRNGMSRINDSIDLSQWAYLTGETDPYYYSGYDCGSGYALQGITEYNGICVEFLIGMSNTPFIYDALSPTGYITPTFNDTKANTLWNDTTKINQNSTALITKMNTDNTNQNFTIGSKISNNSIQDYRNGTFDFNATDTIGNLANYNFKAPSDAQTLFNIYGGTTSAWLRLGIGSTLYSYIITEGANFPLTIRTDYSGFALGNDEGITFQVVGDEAMTIGENITKINTNIEMNKSVIIQDGTIQLSNTNYSIKMYSPSVSANTWNISLFETNVSIIKISGWIEVNNPTNTINLCFNNQCSGRIYAVRKSINNGADTTTYNVSTINMTTIGTSSAGRFNINDITITSANHIEKSGGSFNMNTHQGTPTVSVGFSRSEGNWISNATSSTPYINTINIQMIGGSSVLTTSKLYVTTYK